MALRGQKTISLADFQGKRTTGNLSAMSQDYLLRCDGVMRTGEGPLQTAPTPSTLFTAVGAGDGAVNSMYDFQRSVDRAQFLVYSLTGHKLKFVPVPAFTPETTLLSSVAPLYPWQFTQNNFILYGSNGYQSTRFVDKAGTLTPYQWGINPPASAPSVSVGTVGANSLAHGRRYVYAYVSKYTDSLGVVRVSVGAASPISNYSGPTTTHNVAVPVVASSDLQVTHIWVFETFDAVDGTVDSYYFATELSNATQTFQDGLADSALDQSRQAPFENYPAPSNIVALAMYQNRVVAVGPDFVQFSANGETSLGIDQENFPPDLFLSIPSGSQIAKSAIVINSNDPAKQSCWVGTLDAWYPISSIEIGSIQLGDKIVTPGTVLPNSATLTPTHVMWVGPDLRLWAWNGLTSYLSEVPAQAMDMSEAIWNAIPGTVGMDSIDPSTAFLANAYANETQLKWFSRGSQHFLVMATRAVQAGTPLNTPIMNWVAIWQVDTKGPQITSIREFDIYPQRPSSIVPNDLNALANFELNGLPMLLGAFSVTNATAICDMFGTYGGNVSQPRISTTWLHDESNADCRWLFVDIETDQYQPEQKFTVLAVAAESPDMALTTLNVRQIPDPRANAGNSTRFRCILEGSRGVSFGKYLRLEVLFPTGNTPVKLSKIDVTYEPTFIGTP